MLLRRANRKQIDPHRIVLSNDFSLVHWRPYPPISLTECVRRAPPARPMSVFWDRCSKQIAWIIALALLGTPLGGFAQADRWVAEGGGSAPNMKCSRRCFMTAASRSCTRSDYTLLTHHAGGQVTIPPQHA
jgi:hypothetical protein